MFHPIDPQHFRASLGRFPSGVTVISCKQEGQVYGMTASAFVSVSMEPPLVLVSVANKARMHAHLLAAETFGISVLSQEQAHWSNHFAGKLHDQEPEFAEWDGVPVLEGALVNLVLKKDKAIEAGDHTLFLGEITHTRYTDQDALLYFRGQYGAFQGK
ncbi:flavin reductase family protein [Deinococcus roseus]|uniref:Oxidoreductase n=1 Tax=Deinococcus roseus TaxID=392414 RepID=A0ABQ2DED5_9DEIO|nr:flavin reductase family protein [Deinococcus roseus]GGJ53961.1 oxidoreductase [Deinococcus roseus]